MVPIESIRCSIDLGTLLKPSDSKHLPIGDGASWTHLVPSEALGGFRTER